MFNTLRQMIVKEEVKSSLSSWGQSADTSMTNLVTDIIYKIIPKKGTEQVVKIDKNTGNITFFFNVDSQNVALKTALINCNAGAESIHRDAKLILDNKDVFYALYERFYNHISRD